MLLILTLCFHHSFPDLWPFPFDITKRDWTREEDVALSQADDHEELASLLERARPDNEMFSVQVYSIPITTFLW
jgi:hypothetical protein